MIVQLVNFFHARFRPVRDFFSARNLVFYVLFLLLFFVVTSMGLYHYLDGKQIKLAHLEKGVEKVAVDRAQLSHSNACKTELANLFDTVFRRDSSPVAPLLEQLTTLHLLGGWLTGVEVSQGGHEVLVLGGILPQWSERLLSFVRTLVKQERFSVYRLMLFQIKKEKKFFPSTVAAAPPSTLLVGVSSTGGVLEEGQPVLKFRIVLRKTDRSHQGADLSVSGKKEPVSRIVEKHF